jgi:polyhydroxyalkanoate synthesis regulator phasin
MRLCCSHHCRLLSQFIENQKAFQALLSLPGLLHGVATQLIMEVLKVLSNLRPVFKIFFLAKAAFEVGRERVEDVIDSLTAKAGEYKSTGNDHLQEAKEKVVHVLSEVGQNIWQRSEVLENQTREKVRRQVADITLGALGDTTEINELRAEIATLRAEIAELRSTRAPV